jgi:hypothetical protein
MKIIIDRFEGDMAVVELPDKTMINIPRKLFANASEGDVFDVSADKSETENRRKVIGGLMDELFKD